MNPKEKINFKIVVKQLKGLEKEVKALRKVADKASDCMMLLSHGHTPDWQKLAEAIEKYEDNFQPL